MTSVSLSRRLATTLVALGAVLALVVTVAVVLALRLQDGQDALTRDYFASVQDSHEGFVRALDTSAAASAYLRRGAPDDLAELRRLQQPREDGVDVEQLQERLRDEPRALVALDRVIEVYVRWLTELEPLLAQVEQLGAGSVTEAQLQGNAERFGQVRTDYGAYVAAVLDARNRAADDLSRSADLLFLAVLASVATAVLAGVLLSVALRRWVTGPLTALGQETRTVRTGSLDHEVRVDGPPEIVALADDVDAMRRGLVSQLGEVGRAQALLEQQAEDLRRSNRDLEQFAYVASHDLQEPLRKVSSFCQMLQRRYAGQLDDRADQYIEFAVDGAKRMQALINDLLAFSRVGRMTEGFTEVALDDVLADALRNLSVRVEESGAVVTADPLPVVQGERRLLVQLLQNLIGNGIKFAGDGPPRVHVSAARQDDGWELAVHDDGIGIEPQYADRIFVIFQRLHPKAEYEGTGIGLALGKKIVEHHGGTIRLDTEQASGTTFRFSLPDEPPAPLGAREESAWTTA